MSKNSPGPRPLCTDGFDKLALFIEDANPHILAICNKNIIPAVRADELGRGEKILLGLAFIISKDKIKAQLRGNRLCLRKRYETKCKNGHNSFRHRVPQNIFFSWHNTMLECNMLMPLRSEFYANSLKN